MKNIYLFIHLNCTIAEWWHLLLGHLNKMNRPHQVTSVNHTQSTPAVPGVADSGNYTSVENYQMTEVGILVWCTVNVPYLHFFKKIKIKKAAVV